MGPKPTTAKNKEPNLSEHSPVGAALSQSESRADPSITIHDIARLAGVSIGTVDRVLHNRGKVAPDTLEKIRTILNQSGYRPNVFASYLSGSNTKSIGVLIPESSQDYGYWGLVRVGMEQAAAELEPLRVQVDFETFDRFNPITCKDAFARLEKSEPQSIALAPTPGTLFRPLIEALPLSQNLLFFDTDLECTRPHSFIGQDPYQGGLVSARLLCMLVPPPAVLSVIRFQNGDVHLEQRFAGFRHYCMQQERVVRVIELDQRTTTKERRIVLLDALESIPNITGLFVPNASASECVDLKPGLRIIGYDLVSANVSALKTGAIEVLVSQRPQIMGYESIMRLGRKLVFGESLSTKITLPIDIVLKENLDHHE